MLKHKHHLIPKYKGGLDISENIIELTVTQHAMFHYCNWCLWQNEEDRFAWKGLSKLINKDQIFIEKCKLGARKRNKLPVKDETKKKLSKKLSKLWETKSDTEKNKIIDALRTQNLKRSKSVISKNNLNGEIKIFLSIRSAARYYGMSRETIRKLLLTPNLGYKNLSFEYNK